MLSVTSNAPCPVPEYVFTDSAPVGWASQGGGTTGGGSAQPVLVNSFSKLQSEVSGSTAKVIYVQGELSAGELKFGSHKTVVGCTGASIQGAVKIGKGSANIILRNLAISGYAVGDCALDPAFDASEGCSSGSDAVGINGDAHHIWVDHCSIKDGTDGNLDITNDANFVTVSWTKFAYTARTDNVGSDSTGAAGHRYSNLVGGTDTAPNGWPGTPSLDVTWHHNWWADTVVERQPRVRYGRNHLFNNYYNSSATNYCIRAGIEASVLVEANYFDLVSRALEFNNDKDQQTAYLAIGAANVGAGDAPKGGGKRFTPPYAFELDPADSVPAVVKAGAGPH
jgi:pectate lyase